MKLLFVHDTKLKEDKEGTYYTGGSFSQEVWERYLSVSPDLSVIARKEQTKYDVRFSESSFNHFDSNKINFIEVPDIKASISNFISYSLIKKTNEIIKNAVLENDFIIARLPSTNGSIAVKYCKEYNKPYLVEVVGCSWDAYWNYNLKGKVIAPFVYLQQRKAIKDAKYAIYVTKEFLQQRYPSEGESIDCSNVILPKVDEDIIRKKVEKINSKMNLNKLIIGTIGATDVIYKGQDSVIKVLASLKHIGITNFEYQLVGGGDSARLKEIAQKYGVIDQVQILGSISHSDVIKWLDTIDIYIQPSKTEGLPRALIEAMSRGLFVIGSNVGGIPELVEQKYIISNTKSNIKEITDILTNIDKSDFVAQAKRNFEVSKEYRQEIIESRRQSFFYKFVNQK